MVVINEFEVMVTGPEFTAKIIVPTKIDTNFCEWEILDDFEILEIRSNKENNDDKFNEYVYDYVSKNYIQFFEEQVLSKYFNN